MGPYEVKRVMEQGSTNINGPHQGAWIELENGEDWFIHFQDRGAYGRIIHMNPVQWIDDWPLMGMDLDGNGVGDACEGDADLRTQLERLLAHDDTGAEDDGPVGIKSPGG